MGKRSGLRRVGAKGSEPQLPLAPADAVPAREQAPPLDLRQIAREHTKQAFKTLTRAAARAEDPDGERASWSTAVKAATQVLDYGHGRPAAQPEEGSQAGLTVVIQNFTGLVAGLEAAATSSRPSPAIDITPVAALPSSQHVFEIEPSERSLIASLGLE